MWDVQLKANNKQTRKSNGQKLIDTDNGVVVTSGVGIWVVKDKGGQIYGEGRGFDFGWVVCSAIYK